MNRHLKENKFWYKEDLFSVLPLPYFSFEDHSLWLGTSYLIGSSWGNQGHSVAQSGASPACGPYSPGHPSFSFSLYQNSFALCLILSMCFPLQGQVTWNCNLIIIVNRLLWFKIKRVFKMKQGVSCWESQLLEKRKMFGDEAYRIKKL